MQLTKGAIGNLINRYKAVLKKCHLMNTFGSLAVAGMLVMGGAGMATAADDRALGGGSLEWSGDADHLMGGNLYKGNVTVPEVTTPGDISLSIKGGTIEEIIGGSYVSGNNDQVGNVTLGNISTTIQDGSSTEFVVGGSKISNDADATLATGKTSLTINGGTFGKEGKNDGYELVMGGNYVKTGTDTKNTASAEGSRVTVNNGTFHASVVGGSVAHRYNGNNSIMVEDKGSTSVVINGGTFSPSQSNIADNNGGINLTAAVIGGGLAYGGGSSVLGSRDNPVTSSVTINGGTFKPEANGHYAKIVAGSVVANKGGTAIVHGNTTLAMAGGTAHDDLIGGGMVENAATLPEESTSEYNLNITGDSSVTVTGDSKALGEVIGGNYVKTSDKSKNSAKVANSSVTITGGTFANVGDSASKAQYIIGGSKTNASGGGNATTLVEGNSSVLIDGDVKIKDGALIGGSQAKAGYGNQSEATAIVRGNSSVTVNNGNLAGVVGGGIAETYAQDVTAKSIVEGTSSVTINGGEVTGNSIETGAVASNTGKLSAAVVGGGLANTTGSTATVGSTSVTIATGTINGKVVAGGAAVNGGNSTVNGDTSLTMTDGKVDGDLIGGGFVDSSVDSSAGTANNKANVDGSTHITVSGGSLVDAEIIGGGSVRNANGEANVKGSTHVTVTKYANDQVDQKWVQYVLGGGKAMTNGTQTATANVAGNTNVIIGEQGAIGEALDIQYGTVAGGGLARAQKAGDTATANVDNNANVTVHSGILSGVAGGGIAENYNTGTAKATVTNANLTINGGTINAVKYGKVDNSPFAVVGGGIAYSTGGSAIASVGTANTTINGGTINGHVLAGGIADGANTTATVTNANLTITGGEIDGSVYAGGAALNSDTATVENFDVRITGGTITGDVVAGNYTGDTGASTFTLLGASPYSGGSSKGSITIGGDANIGGGVSVGDGVKANVIIDGDDAQVDKGYTGNAESTLTFQNYNTDFNKVATGFGTLEAAAGSNVTLTNLSTGAQTGDKTGFFGGGSVSEITVTGEGTVTATNVNVDGSKTLTVADGGTLVAESLTTADNSTAKTDGLGSTLIIRNDALENIAAGSLSSTAGSEIKFTGLGESVAATDITDKLDSTTNTGIVNVGDTKVTGLSSLVVDGEVDYNQWVTSGTAGITNNELKHATMTGVHGTNAADEAPDKLNGVAVSGIKLNSDNAYIGIHKSSNVTLTGLGGGENFVSRKDGSTGGILLWNGDNKITLGDNAYTGSKKITHIGFGGGKHTVNALGQDRNASRIIVTMGINGKHTNASVVNASHVTLQVEKTIGDFNNPSANHHLSVNADAANVLAGDHILVGSLSLKNGSLVQAGKDIVISGTADSNLSGQGMVDAGQTLTLAKGYTGVEDDDLLLTAKTLNAKDAINSTKGDLAIMVTSLVTNDDTTLVDDTLVADNVQLGGALNASGKSLVEVGGFYTDESFETEGLNNAVSVTGQSLMVYGAGAEQAQQAVAETGHTGAAYYAGKELKLVDGGSLTVGNATATTTVAFGSDSLLVVDGTAMNGKTVFTGTVSGGPEAAPDLTASVDAGSKLHVDNAVAGNFTVFGDGFTSPVTGWADENVTTDSAMLDASYNATNKNVTVKTNNAHTVFPNLSDGMADAVNDLYNGKLNNVDSTDMGVRFLSRATNDHFLGADKDAAAATIESAARIAFAGAVPQMTKMASDAGSNAVVNRLGFANPADGAQAMNAEGKIVDRNTTGFALWIAPLWQSQHGWGMEADNLDYGFNGNLGGVSLGADYTFENAIRAGITFNIGGGYAESSGGDLNSTENRMSFWGLGAYAGWNYENFGLMADVSYTSTWNDLKQDMDSRMGMGDLEADVQASAISAGLRAEYKLETSVLDVIPHIGVRYMSLNTWGFDAESNGGTVLEGDGFHQDIWTFPVGVTFTKDFTLDSGWSFKPSIDFSVIPAAGDIKAKQDVAFTGLPGSYEVETQMMDYLTWQGGVGLEMGNDTMSFGVNYTLQAGQHTTGHGVFGSFRYEF